MRNCRLQRNFLQAFLLATCCLLLATLIGCDAFVRKFTRKPKKEKVEEEVMVLAPEEYKGPQMTQEEIYRQYFLFWKSWQDELIISLSEGGNRKKQIDCTEEAIKNLQNLRELLQETKKKTLDVYINQLESLRDSIRSDLYGSNVAMNRQNAERIRRNTLRDFSYQKIKNDLL